MRYKKITLPLLAFSLILNTALAQEHYFRLIEPNKSIINSTITQTVSIDRVIGDTIFAFASSAEYAKLISFGFAPDELPFPTASAKAKVMAASLTEMASWDRYPTYEVYREMMKAYEKNYPALCKLDSIGTTVDGRRLYVVKISDKVLQDEAEPEFFYTSTMHGDEITGYVLMLRLIDYLLTNYETDSRVANLVNNIAIFINPNANPDGTYYYGNSTVNGARRYNANNYDINRNFPDPRAGSNPNGPHQPETVAMMNFAASRNFVLSANFHGGIELANFPWDTWTSSTNRHADHNWFYKISRQYADNAQTNSPAGYFTGENNGVTHGGDWYVVAGGRQDYMNYWHHCREITLEISGTKAPESSLLPNFWNYNREAMLTYMELALTGISGSVTNSQGEPLHATITIAGHDKDNSHLFTNPVFGNYTRFVDAGTWNITYSAENYISQTHSVTLDNFTTSVTKNIILREVGQHLVEVEVKHQNEPITNATITLNGQAQTTNSIGLANFGSITSGTYPIVVNADGFNQYEDNISIESDTTVAIILTPVGVKVLNSTLNTLNIWPNPFFDFITIEFTIGKRAFSQIDITQVSGQTVATILNETLNPGLHSFVWQPNKSLSQGYYIVRVKVDNTIYSRKILFSPNPR